MLRPRQKRRQDLGGGSCKAMRIPLVKKRPRDTPSTRLLPTRKESARRPAENRRVWERGERKMRLQVTVGVEEESTARTESGGLLSPTGENVWISAKPPLRYGVRPQGTPIYKRCSASVAQNPAAHHNLSLDRSDGAPAGRAHAGKPCSQAGAAHTYWFSCVRR